MANYECAWYSSLYIWKTLSILRPWLLRSWILRTIISFQTFGQQDFCDQDFWLVAAAISSRVLNLPWPDSSSLHPRVRVAYAFLHLPESVHLLNLLVPFGTIRTTPGIVHWQRDNIVPVLCAGFRVWIIHAFCTLGAVSYKFAWRFCSPFSFVSDRSNRHRTTTSRVTKNSLKFHSV